MPTAVAIKSPGQVSVPLPPSVGVLLTEGDMFATAMALLVMDVGLPAATVFGYSRSTLGELLEEKHGVYPSEDNLDRLMAAIAVVTTDLFWNDAEAFMRLANILAGSGFSEELDDPADPAECAWAVTEATLLAPEAAVPSPDVVAYLQVACTDFGYPVPPKALRKYVQGNRDALHAWADHAEVLQEAEARARQVDAWVADEVGRYFDQLASLPLRSANARNAIAKIRSSSERK